MISKRVLILGYGRLGSQIAVQLHDTQTFSWSRTGKTSRNSGVSKFFFGNFLDAKLDNLPVFDAVIFAISPSSSTEESYKLTYELMVLKALEELRFKKFILCSSTGIYGHHQGRCVDEQSELLIDNFKSHFLNIAEINVRNLAFNDFLICRLSGLYSCGNPPPSSWLDSHHWSNRIHLQDAARAIAAAVHYDQRLCDIVNLTDDYPFLPSSLCSRFKLSENMPRLFSRNLRQESKKVLNYKSKGMFGNYLQFPTIFHGYKDYLKHEHLLQ